MFIDLNEEKFKVSLSLPMQLSFPEYKTFPPSIQFWNTGSFSFSIVGAIHEISPKLSFLSDFADLVAVSKVLISDYNEQVAVKAVMVFFVQFFFFFFWIAILDISRLFKMLMLQQKWTAQYCRVKKN